MDQETIKLTLRFMERVQLQGAEVPAFNQCVAALARLGEMDNLKEVETDGDSERADG